MKITNSLTKQKEEFVPTNEKKVNMFVCGPTVYDYIHIGNARIFVFFDMVAKYLRFKGYEVNYIQNITDIENKIMERAQKEGGDSLEYAQKYTEFFKQDMIALDVTSPEYKNATDHIPEVIKQVQILLDKGNAYIINNDPETSSNNNSEAGGIYFDLATFHDYGKLSGRTTGMANDAVSRIDENAKKRNRGDFSVWKFSKANEPTWNFNNAKYLGTSDGSPAFTKASAGRPGWHIEDTAITEKYFGPQYDLHGGGEDLIFPHHEAEIAQQESASGKKPFVKYWMHVAFLINKGEKMSKSLGNFETVNKLLQKYSKETLRFYLLSGYYRYPLDFNDKILKQSEAGANRIYGFVQKLNLATGNGSKNIERRIKKSKQEFLESMDSDFNTPQSFAIIFDLIRQVNLDLVNNSLDKNSLESLKMFIGEIDLILGIVPIKQEKIPNDILGLVEKREKLREEKNWSEADKTRAQIEDLGWKIEDTIYGPLVSNSGHNFTS